MTRLWTIQGRRLAGIVPVALAVDGCVAHRSFVGVTPRHASRRARRWLAKRAPYSFSRPRYRRAP